MIDVSRFFSLWSVCSLITLSLLSTPTLGGAQLDPAPSQAPESTRVAIDFDHYETGPVPAIFSPILSGQGAEVSWEIRSDPSALSGRKVLTQNSYEQVDYRFPLLIYDKLLAQNVHVVVQFRPVSGKVDQAAGIILRFQDPAHFYVVRANALEDTVQLYRVINGERQVVAGATVDVATGQWHALEVTARDASFTVTLDGQQLFEARDEAIAAAGKVGLSTKSDGVTLFDDFQVTVLDQPQPTS